MTIEKLVERANQLANTGHWDQAELTWLEVRRLDPQQPQALFSLGVHALQRGDFVRGRQWLLQAHQRSPDDLLVLMTIASGSMASLAASLGLTRMTFSQTVLERGSGASASQPLLA